MLRVLNGKCDQNRNPEGVLFLISHIRWWEMLMRLVFKNCGTHIVLPHENFRRSSWWCLFLKYSYFMSLDVQWNLCHVIQFPIWDKFQCNASSVVNIPQICFDIKSLRKLFHLRAMKCSNFRLKPLKATSHPLEHEFEIFLKARQQQRAPVHLATIRRTFDEKIESDWSFVWNKNQHLRVQWCKNHSTT